MPVNVEIKCSLRENFEGLQCPRTPSCQEQSAQKLQTSNTGGSQFFGP